MKNIVKNSLTILSLVAVFILANSFIASDKSKPVVTETIKVNGVCGMCKKRIETAAYAVKGVETAKWVSKDQVLTITFDNQKTTKEAIAKRIAAAGHDVEMVKANDKAYSKLPECCQYRDGAECEH